MENQSAQSEKSPKSDTDTKQRLQSSEHNLENQTHFILIFLFSFIISHKFVVVVVLFAGLNKTSPIIRDIQFFRSLTYDRSEPKITFHEHVNSQCQMNGHK